MTFGVAVTLISQRASEILWFDWAAVACLLVAFITVCFVANPVSRTPSVVLVIPAILLAWTSFILSVLGHIGGPRLMVEIWWAPIGVSFLIAALAPYSSAFTLAIIGSASAAFTGAVITFVPFNRVGYWPPFTEGLIGSGPVLVAAAAASVFAYQVVMRVLRWSASEPGSTLTSGVLGESARLNILRVELASVGDRTLPFLRKIADSGVVTATDREQARLLAEEVRAELVERANRSWLDTLATRMNVTVVDAEHRADRMTANQRAALLGLLSAVNESAGGGRSSTLIQLRGEPDGSTAVALSTDVHLPDGRRTTLLAPYYFSLKATVDDLEWSTGDRLGLQFRLPPEAGKGDSPRRA